MNANQQVSKNLMLESALAYARRGIRVFPLHWPIRDPELRCSCAKGKDCAHKGKHPLTMQGVYDATTSEDLIRGWWTEQPNANIAIATGSASGIDIIDFDPRHGGDANLEELLAKHGDFPRGPVVETGSGGGHVYGKAVGLVSKSHTIATGVDTKGDGGYVVAPPSVHESGNRYAWLAGCSIHELEPIQFPEWVISRAKKKASSPVDWAEIDCSDRPPEVDLSTETEFWTLLDSHSDDHQARIPGDHVTTAKRARAGEPLLPAGHHHHGIWAFLSWMVFKLQWRFSNTTILRMLEPSVVAMKCRDHGLSTVEIALHLVNQQYAFRTYVEPQQIWKTLLKADIHRSGGAAHNSNTEKDSWYYPDGYAPMDDVGRMGVFKAKGDAALEIAAAPISVIETGEDESGTCYVTLKYLRHGNERILTVPREKISRGTGLLSLAANGAPITDSNKQEMTKFLGAQEERCAQHIKKVRIYTSTGWTSDLKGFALGETVIGAQGRVVIPGASPFLHALVRSGSADDHLRTLIEVRDRSPLAEMAVSAGFAPFILRLIGARSLCFSICGASGGGKSAVQAAAASIIGRPSVQMITGDVTHAAIQAELAIRRDLMTWIDDTQLTREQFLDLIAYIVGTGKSASRATQTGDLRGQKSWNTVAFVSGEKSLLRIGGAAGAVNRTIEASGKPLDDLAFAQRVHQQLELTHGHAGPIFVEQVLERFAAAGRLNELRERARGLAASLSSAHSEHVRQVAVLVLADVLSRVLVFEENEGPAERAALDAGKVVLENVLGEVKASLTTFEAAYMKITSWIAARMQDFEPFVRDRVGVLHKNHKEAGGRTVAAVFTHQLDKFAKESGFDLKQVLGLLKEHQLLLVEGKKITRKTETGNGRTRAYHIILDGDLAESE